MSVLCVRVHVPHVHIYLTRVCLHAARPRTRCLLSRVARCAVNFRIAGATINQELGFASLVGVAAAVNLEANGCASVRRLVTFQNVLQNRFVFPNWIDDIH